MSLTQQGTVRILEAFRQSNANYAARLPQVTIDNVLEVGGIIATDEGMFNDFVRLIARVAESYVTTPKFENPLERNKRAVNKYGELIEEIFIGLVQSKAFRSDDPAVDLFKAEKPNLDAVYYRRNREEKYKVTIDRVALERALTEEGGISRIVDTIIESMHTSNKIDEYEYMKALLEGAYKKGEMYFVEVGDIFNDSDAQRKFIKKAKEYAHLVRFKNNFNARGVETTTNKESMTLYMPARVSAEIDVDVLAKAFNMGKTEIDTREIVLDRFADDNMLAVLVDDSFFIVADHLRTVTSQFDASALKTNYWLHIHQTIARSPFATAIVFVKQLPENVSARLIISPNVAIVTGEPERKANDVLTVHTSLEGFDGTTDDLSNYTLTAEADTDGVDVEVDVHSVNITVNSNAEPGENFTVTFTASYGEGKQVTAKGNYTISKYFDPSKL